VVAPGTPLTPGQDVDAQLLAALLAAGPGTFVIRYNSTNDAGSTYFAPLFKGTCHFEVIPQYKMHIQECQFVTGNVLVADVDCVGCLIKSLLLDRAVCAPLCPSGTYESSPCSTDGDRQCTGVFVRLQEVGYSFNERAPRGRGFTLDRDL
jgi:hypothetical protein